MNKFKWYVLFLAVFGLLGVGSIPAMAQDCGSGIVYIDDSTSEYSLDREAICAAAQQWVARSFNVLVYLTDYAPSIENPDWFNHLDQVEAYHDFRQGNFQDASIAFEASTMTPNTFAGNVTIGLLLENTPLGRSDLGAQLKANFLAALQSGDPTAAFVNLMNASYRTAFPPPVPTQPPQPTPQPQPTVIVQAGPVTQVQVDTQPIVNAVGSGLVVLIVVVLVGGSGVFIVVRVVMPEMARRRRETELRVQSDKLSTLTGTLITKYLEKVIGSDPLNGALYTIWTSMGGNKYAQRDGQFRKTLSAATEVFNILVEARKDLKRKCELPPDDPNALSIEEAALRWEQLYLTIVGTSETVTGMTTGELEELINPLSVLERAEIDDDLVKQIEAVFTSLQEGSEILQITLLVADPSQVNAKGILGYIETLKLQLAELQAAKADAEPALNEALAAHQEFVKTFVFQPELMTLDEALVFVSAQLEAAKTALAEELWLDAKTAAQTASAVINWLPERLTTYYRVSAVAKERLSGFDAIAAQGFDLKELKALPLEVSGDMVAFKAAVATGDLAKADEFLGEIEADSLNALTQAQALPALQQKNTAQLFELSQKVASVQDYADQTVKPNWVTLQVYPASNWSEVGENFATAEQTLRSLFDDPAIDTDLASEIGDQNSMEKQQFTAAERMLAEAFAQLSTAEAQLKAVDAQLELVRAMEKNVADALSAAQSDLEKAVARRDQQNALVDAEVDQLLSESGRALTEAHQNIVNREFTLASELIKKARQNANKAYASANDQIEAINAALQEVERFRTAVSTQIAEAVNNLNELPASARSEQATRLIAQATESLESVRRAEQRIAGNEDRELLEALRAVNRYYGQAQEQAQQAIAAIQQDKARYDQAFQQAESAVKSAQSAINSAETSVSDTDANGAGRSALNRAKTLLPSMLSYGAAYDALVRLVAVAGDAKEAAELAEREADAAIKKAEEDDDDGSTFTGSTFRSSGSGSSLSRSTSRSSFGSSTRSSGFSSSSRSSSHSSGSRSSSFKSSGTRH